MIKPQQRVAVYARISEDSSGEEAGVGRQIADARALAAQRGTEVVSEYRDDSISALNGKHRPGYERMMADAEAGMFSAIVVYHLSRLWRNRIERANGIDLLRNAGVSVSTVKGPELDLSTAAGRGMAGLLGEFDTMESEVKSERVARAALQRAETGAPNGAIGFGWRREYDTNDKGERVQGSARDVHHPDEAPIVAEVCHRLLSGETIIGVTRWLNSTGVPAPGADFRLRSRERGITNPTGAEWGKTSVRKLAMRPANCGLRRFHSGRRDERLLRANIEPIITRDEWDRLGMMMANNSPSSPRPGGRKHLLSWGIGECGVCGSVLRVAQAGKPGSKKSLYACNARSTCVGRNQIRVDDLVAGYVAERLHAADLRDLMAVDAPADDALARVSALRARLDQATLDYSQDIMDREQFILLTKSLREQLSAAERDAASTSPTVPFELLAEVAGPEARDNFDVLTVVQQRTLVQFLIDKVRILPTRRGPGFDPASVEVVFHADRDPRA